MLTAIATILGTTIGAGILGIPYAISKVGFLPGIVLICLIGVATMFLNLMYAEVTLRTRQDHEIPGYGGLYLGTDAKMLALLAGLIGSYGALLAYIIGEGHILTSLWGGNATVWSYVFIGFGSYIVYRGVEIVKKIEFVMSLALLTVLFLIGIAVQPHIVNMNLAYVDVNNIIVPYGVLMFAFSGSASIPMVRQQLKGQEKKLPLAILIANSIILCIYFVFAWLVLGVTGAQTTQVATIGLGLKVGPGIRLLGNVLAGITLLSGYVAMGLSVRRLFENDYGMSRIQACLVTIVIPVILFTSGARSFITVLGIVGGLLLSLQSVIIILSFWKSQEVTFWQKITPSFSRRKPEFTLGKQGVLGVLLILLYIFGAVLTILNHV